MTLQESPVLIGLRVDVDTFRGTKYGVPNLCEVLADYTIRASFFFSVGPDNMGRHLWRLIRPSFLKKMLRTRASSLYGWDILLRGTLWPGPLIGKKLGYIIRAVADAGHEVGLHAWDHRAWQKNIASMDRDAIHRHLKQGVDVLTRILGEPPTCSAAPAWKANDLVLMAKEQFPFTYNSDCRGKTIFRPCVLGKELSQPQIPVTLPTYDEVVGSKGISDSTYNDYLFSLLAPQELNILTIHAEVEGMALLPTFRSFLKTARSRGMAFAPLGSFLTQGSIFDSGTIAAREIPGRDGWVSWQAPVASHWDRAE
jgi:undecaprenyl phosphate-alpha-L-ara4FN deformylase